MKRVFKFEEKLSDSNGRVLVKNCWQEKREGRLDRKSLSMRNIYLNGNGYNQLGLELSSESGEKATCCDRKTGKNRETEDNCIRKSRYNARYEMINTMNLPVYLRSESNFKDVKRLARARCGNVEEALGRAERNVYVM